MLFGLRALPSVLYIGKVARGQKPRTRGRTSSAENHFRNFPFAPVLAVSTTGRTLAAWRYFLERK